MRDVPDGSLAVAALSVGFGVWRRMKQRKSDQTLERVVDSWEQTVNPPTEQEKAKVKMIQGEAATERVGAIRARLSPPT